MRVSRLRYARVGFTSAHSCRLLPGRDGAHRVGRIVSSESVAPAPGSMTRSALVMWISISGGYFGFH